MDDRPKIELIVAADEPALFYSSVRRAETNLEAIDVRDGVYTAAYGPEGQAFRIEAIGDRVRIYPIEGAPPRPDELRALLMVYLEATGVRDIDDEPLPSLLARCRGALR